MNKPVSAVRRRPGPRPRLVDAERLEITLPAADRKLLEVYADKHRISLSEAMRRGIDLLLRE